MQKILKVITPIFIVMALFACDTLKESERYPLNPLSIKQKQELDLLLDHKTKEGEGKGIYKVRFDTVNDYTVLRFMYSEKQTDLSDLTSFLFDNDLINKNYIPQETLDSMVRVKERQDSIKLAEALENEEYGEDPNIIIEEEEPVEEEILIDSTEEESNEDSIVAPSVAVPLLNSPNIIENADSL